MAGERFKRWTDRHGPVLALAMAVLGGLIGVFNRSLAYHDEILNTNKAMESIVLDYAMRPVFYGLNLAAMKVFGNHTYAMVILSVVSLGITALLIYSICQRYLSSRLGLLAVVILLGINMVRDFGVRAMAHMHAGMFMTLSLFFALACFADERASRQRLYGVLAGFFAIVSFSTHPTMAGYLVGLCSFAAITWFLYLIPATRRSALALPIRPALWIAIGVAGALLALMALYALCYREPYLAAWWRFARVPQGTEAEKELSLFYVRTLLLKCALPFAFLAGSLLVATLARIAGRAKAPAQAFSRYRSFALAMTLYCLVVGAAMVSLNQWKHERLLVSYVPLVVLSCACWLALAGEGLRALLPVRWARFVVTFAVVLLCMRSVQGVRKQARIEAQHAEFARSRYLSLYEALRNLPDSAVGIIRGPGKLGTKASFVRAAGLEYHALPPLKKLAEMSSQDIAGELAALKVRYLYWDLESTSEVEYERVAEKFRALGGSAIHNWRGIRELWLVPSTSTTFGDSLKALTKGSKIGVFGEPTELSTGAGYAIRVIIESNKLDAYVLNVNKRTSRRQLYYLTRNRVDYLILPATALGAIGDDSIAAMQETLLKIGASKLAEDGDPRLQLWHIPDRARAAAYAAN